MTRDVSGARKRLRWALAWLAAFVGAGVMSVTASAVNPNIFDFVTKTGPGDGQGVVPDPQTTNYPGQAAIGQTLRFSFCDLTVTVNAGTGGTLDGATVVWEVANWTGDGAPFKVKESRVVDGLDSCFLVDYGSHKPGLLDLKFLVTYGGTGTGGGVSKHHAFLGIWQQIHDVTLSVDGTAKTLHTQDPAKYDDPNLAGKDGVPIIAKVRGSFPLGNKGKKGKSTVILPDDFGWLAQQFAVDGGNTSFGGAGAAYRWDIHDDQLINKKVGSESQHPYCQTFYPFTDDTGYNLYLDPPPGLEIRHPYYCNPITAKRPVPKAPAFFAAGLEIQAIIDVDEPKFAADPNDVTIRRVINFSTPPTGITASDVNPFTTVNINMVLWPTSDEDAVTNPSGALQFSDIHGRNLPAVDPEGPYDQRRVGDNAGAESNYYPNGVTDAGDVTSPAWRIDFQIQPNGSSKNTTKGEDAIDGAGFLAAVDKNFRTHFDKDGNEDFTLPAITAVTGINQPEEQTGPFHSRDVPALADEVGVGTTNSPGSAQNSVGYLFPGGTTPPRYDFWDLIHSADIDQNRGRPTKCTDYFSSDGTIQNVRFTPGSHGVFGALPAAVAPDLAVVYADEHGQGEVQLKPGFGFYFDQLAYIATGQGGCDLQGIVDLGTATVIATAHYPDQQSPGFKPVASGPITKQWKNGFNVQLSFAPKAGPGAGWRVTAWKTDINGNAPADARNEVVCLSATNGTVAVPSFVAPAVANETTTVAGMTPGPQLQCAKLATRAFVGSAFFDVVGDPEQIVMANFVTEQIKRQITLTATSGGGNPPLVDGDGNPVKPDTFAATTTPTNGQLRGAGLLTTYRIAKVNRVKYKKVRVNGKVRKGKIWLKAQSPTKRVRVKFSLMAVNRKGSWVAIRTLRKTVKANTKKFVKVKVIKPARLAGRIKRVDAVIVRTQGRLIS